MLPLLEDFDVTSFQDYLMNAQPSSYAMVNHPTVHHHLLMLINVYSPPRHGPVVTQYAPVGLQSIDPAIIITS